MKLLMFMRDALPPSRVDVSVLFDRCLRGQGIATDFVGHPQTSPVRTEGACIGRQFEVGPRNDPRTAWRELCLLWRHAQAYDLIVVRDKPLLAGALFVVAALRRRPCVYWMSFPMPLGDRMGAALHWSAGRRLYGALAWLRGTAAQWVQDRFVLRGARHVFVQSQRMLDEVRVSARLLRTRISAVPMGIDTARLPSFTDEATSAHKRVAYLGSLDRARRLDVLIDAFVLVLNRHADARLVLVGWAPRDEDVAWLKAHAASRGVLGRVEFTGALPMGQAWARVSEAMVCVSPVPPGPLHDVSSPTKVVEYLALGLPVVANDIPDQRQLLEACGGGVCVAFTAPAFAQAISDLLDDPVRSREQALKARPKVLALRSYDVLSQQVAQALRRAVV